MDDKTRVQVTHANLISQGLVEQIPGGIRLTKKGINKAQEVWIALPDEHKFLLVPYLRKQLGLAFPEEIKDD